MSEVINLLLIGLFLGMFIEGFWSRQETRYAMKQLQRRSYWFTKYIEEKRKNKELQKNNV